MCCSRHHTRHTSPTCTYISGPSVTTTTIALSSLGRGRSDLLHGVARRSPLQLAARFDFLGIAKNLVAAGARVDHASACDGRTALHVAARFESVAVAQLLVDRGCDLSPRTTCGRALTPLHVSDSPQAKVLSPTRITEGTFADGQKFKMVDAWRASKAHTIG